LALILAAAIALPCAPSFAAYPWDSDDYNEGDPPDPNDPDAPPSPTEDDYEDEEEGIMDKIGDILGGLAGSLVGGIGGLIGGIAKDFVSGGKDDKNGKDTQNSSESDADKAKFIFDTAIFGTLLVDALQAADELGVEHRRYESYKDNYDADHRKMGGGIFSSVAGQFDASSLHSMMASGGAVSYAANPSVAVTNRAPGLRTGVGVYSAIYKDRRETWQNDMKGALEGNRSQTAETGANADNIIKNLDDASFDAKGYMELLQAGAASENYMNATMLGMRSDTIRQTDAQLRLWLEKIQDGADEVSAFEGAVGTWANPASGTAKEY
jgi:hypothetical protein